MYRGGEQRQGCLRKEWEVCGTEERKEGSLAWRARIKMADGYDEKKYEEKAG